MKPLIDYNFKNNRKILFYPAFILYLLLALGWLTLGVYMLVKMVNSGNAFVGVFMILVFSLCSFLFIFYALGFLNTRIIIYDYKIVFYDILKREHQFKTNAKETLFKAQFFNGFTIYNLKTNTMFKTYSFRRTFYTNKLLKSVGIEVKNSLFNYK